MSAGAECPQCGGVERIALGPGLFECQSRRLVNVVPRGQQFNVTDIPIYENCGFRYQEGSAENGRCECGLFAIGKCMECKASVCGKHAHERRTKIFCHLHASQFDAEKAAAAEAAQSRARESRKRAVAEWESRVAVALSEIADPVERMVRAVAEIRDADTKELKQLIPSSLSDQLVADWFVENVGGSPPDRVNVPKKGFFGVKDRYLPCWTFLRGSRATKNYPGGNRQLAEISILADGRVHYDRSFEPTPEDGFNEAALQQIMELLDLQPLSATLPNRPGNPFGLFFTKP